ncbi:type I polyketide synthase [Streptomyces parvus]|uniref:type I polyketide synthase n=1 Tax=Streptomyces parvus TaxID=66428 RepID=UPI003666BB86
MGAEQRDPSIAVVGMAFRLPGADTPEDLWRVIRNGESRFTRFTRDDLEAAGVPEELYGREDFIGTSAILDDISGFDARHFGMTAREARLTDPQQRLFLECAQHALENAGYPDERDGRRIGVYASAGYHLYNMQSYLMNNVLPNEDIGDWLAGMQVMVGNFTDFNATRVAYRLGLTGPAINVQTACSSSLVGVQLAANSLLLDECDIALVGSGSIHVPQVLGYHYVKGSILSKTGRLRAFDAGADGTVGGTGILAVVLKRLDRALADGDTVHGVIRGWGVCNDGSDKKTFAAPSESGQQKAVRRALDHAGVGADTIGYLETHGTGTLKGDPIELAGASAAYRQDTDRTGYCALGAIKANIGHLDVGAGLAGLVKTLLVLKHGVIPPIAGFSTPNPLLGLESSPFYVPDALRPWPETGTPRRAGVTSLGVGGTNVHIVLEEAPEPAPRTPRAAPPPDVLLVSATSREALADNARSLRDHLRRHTALPTADLVTTAALGRTHGGHRIAVRGTTPVDLAEALDDWLARAEKSPAPAGDHAPAPDAATRVVFQFTGQGSLRPGAAAALYERFPVVREVLDICEEHHRHRTDESLLPILATGDKEPLDGGLSTATAQPALYALQCALVRLWQEAGIQPSAVTGHSVGEYAALHAAGALSLEDGLALSAHRGRLMRDHCKPGLMVAVMLGREEATELAASCPGVELAVTNGKRSQVLAGPVADMEALCALLTDRDIAHERLGVDRAFHTATMDPMLDGFRAILATTRFTPVRTPFISSLDGRTRPPGWTPDAEYLLRHVRRPVRYDAALGSVAAEHPDVLLEIGPHTTLSGLARRALPTVRATPSLHRGSGLTALYGAAAALHCAGADVRWEPFLAGTAGRRVPLPGYRFQHRHYWVGEPPRPRATMNPVREERIVTAETTETTHLLDGILGVLSRAFGEELTSVAADTPFFDLGADSLLMINVLREIEEEHQVKVTMRELFDETGTPRLLAELIAARLPREHRTTIPAPAPTAAPSPVPQQRAAEPSPVRQQSVAEPSAEAQLPASPPPSAGPESAPDADDSAFITRREYQELAGRVEQLSRIQLQMLTQLSQLLTLQAGATVSAPAREGVR